MKKFLIIFLQIIVSLFFALFISGILIFFLLPFVGLLDETLALNFSQISKASLWNLFSLFGILALFLNLFFIMQRKWRLVGLFLIFLLASGLYFIYNYKDVPKAQKIEIAQIEDCSENKTLLRAKACTILVSGDNYHGSGFLINPQGYAVTNYHVVQNSTDGSIYVTASGVTQEAYIVGYDASKDIAVIKTPIVGLANCTWVDSSELELAENVYAIGWPNDSGGDSTITKGIFSRYVEFEDGMRMIQTDTPINPGNSGGPLVNACGVIGVNTSKISWIDDQAPSEGLGYAISSNFAVDIVNSIIQNDTGTAAIPQVLTDNAEFSNDYKIENEASIYDSTPSPYDNVAYDFEQVLFWEERMALDREIEDSWNDNVGSEFLSATKLKILLSNLNRLRFLSEELWDGYTNSKITYQQAASYKEEYWKVNKEASLLTQELNKEGSLNSFNACVDSWKALEDEYDMDFDSQIKECDSYLN